MEIFCVHCGRKNLKNAIFCQHCGNKLIIPESPKCGDCGAEIKPEMVFCPSCGSEIGAETGKSTMDSPIINDHTPSSNEEILEMIIVAEPGGLATAQRWTLILYKDFLILAKGGSKAAGAGEVLGWAAGGWGGSKIGQSLEKGSVDKYKSSVMSNPQEILARDPENTLLNYEDIISIKMSSSFLGGSKIQINSNHKVYKYWIPEFKKHKNYVKSLKFLLGEKIIT